MNSNNLNKDFITNATEFLLKNYWLTLALTVLLYINTNFIFLPSLIVALFTLSLGLKYGIVIAGSLLLSNLILDFNLSFKMISDILIFISLLLSASTLRNTQSWGLTLLMLAIVASVSIALMIYLDYVKNYVAIINAVLTTSSELNSWLMLMLKAITEYPEYFVILQLNSSFVIFNFIALFFARLLQSKVYNPGALAKEILQTKIHPIGIFLIALSFIALNFNYHVTHYILFFPIATAFIISGIALVHFFINYIGKFNFAFILFYMSLFIIMTIMIPLLIMLAVIDSVTDLRKKLDNFNQKS